MYAASEKSKEEKPGSAFSVDLNNTRFDVENSISPSATRILRPHNNTVNSFIEARQAQNINNKTTESM